MELEDEADIPVAESRQFISPNRLVSVPLITSRPLSGASERADDLQQGCLTRPAGAYDSDNLALVYREVDAFQYL